MNMQRQLAARQLVLNDVGYCNLYLDQPVAFESYSDNLHWAASSSLIGIKKRPSPQAP